jgi:hypothetical protein
MASSRDQCFQDALERYKDTHPDDPYNDCDVEHEPAYRKHPETGRWWKVNRFPGADYFNEMLELKMRGKNFGQLRKPDMVLRCPDGRTYVVDNKFSKDRFRGDQKRDYEEIERDENNDLDTQDARATTPANCDCSADYASNPIYLPYAPRLQPGRDWFPIIIPGVPSLPPLPNWVPSVPPLIPNWLRG